MSVSLLLPQDSHPVVLWGISPSFPGLSPAQRWVTYVLLTRPPLTSAKHWRLEIICRICHMRLFPSFPIPGALHWPVRLACVKHAASVRSEPGSNSQKLLKTNNGAYFLVFKELLRNLGVQAVSFSPKAYREKERLYLNSITSVYQNIELTTRIIYYSTL